MSRAGRRRNGAPAKRNCHAACRFYTQPYACCLRIVLR